MVKQLEERFGQAASMLDETRADILVFTSFPMATAAAIDRIVHHSVILEFDLPSYRTNAAQNRQAENETDRQN